jgi:hypothetical protein
LLTQLCQFCWINFKYTHHLARYSSPILGATICYEVWFHPKGFNNTALTGAQLPPTALTGAQLPPTALTGAQLPPTTFLYIRMQTRTKNKAS